MFTAWDGDIKMSNPIITITPEQADYIQKKTNAMVSKILKKEKMVSQNDRNNMEQRFFNGFLAKEAVRQFLGVEKELDLDVQSSKKYSGKSDFMYCEHGIKIINCDKGSHHAIKKSYDKPFYYVFTIRLPNLLAFEIIGVTTKDVLNDEDNQSKEVSYGLGLRTFNDQKTGFNGYDKLMDINSFKEALEKQYKLLQEGRGL